MLSSEAGQRFSEESPDFHFTIDEEDADALKMVQSRLERAGQVLVSRNMWRRAINTFFRHFSRIFGRVVTRVEYTIAANEHKQFVPTLKMYVVRAKRVSVQKEEVMTPPPREEKEQDGNEGEHDDDGAEAYKQLPVTTTASPSAAPLSCEAWESALNERLLSEVDAPTRDLFPDASVKRQQKMAKYLRTLEQGGVEEVCRPFHSSWLPPWLQAQFAWSGSKSSTRLVHSSVLDKCAAGSFDSAVDGITEECKNALDQKTSEFRCDVSVPIHSHSCLVLESIYRDRQVGVSVSQVYVWDTAVIGFTLFLVLIGLLRPVLVSNRYLQIGASGALGIFFVLVVIIALIIKDLRKTRLGQLGVVAMITAVGVASFSETVTSMLWYYVTVESRTNPYVQAGLVIGAVAAAFISRFFFYDKVPTITNYSLISVQVAAWVALCAHNREASAIIAVLLLVGKMRGPLTLAVNTAYYLGWLVVAVITLPFILVKWILTRKGGTENYEPRDEFPAEVALPQAYVRPMVTEGIFGATAEAKFKTFESQGSDFTRKALKDLALQIRANPTALKRVHDPNGLARFAGLTGDLDMEDDE